MQTKPYLKDLKPYPPGKTIDEIRRELGIKGPIYKLNSNENPLGPSPKAIRVIKNLAKEVHLYPEASYKDLKIALANLWKVDQENIVLGNGSNEVLELVCKALLYPEDEVIVSHPSFLMYEKFAQIYGAKLIEVPLASDYRHDVTEILKNLTSKTKIIFLDHPNNPTGSVIKRKEWYQFFKALPREVLVVIDEAYGEFIDDREVPLGIEFLNQGFSVLVLRTFSKAYGLAGLRLGYGITSKELAKLLDSVRQPFNINLIAYRAGLAALEDTTHLKKTITLVKKGRNYLTRHLSKLGFKVYPSQANFLMVDFGERCEVLYKNLLSQGILLRPLSAYGFSSCLRITIGKPKENRILVRIIQNFISHS